MMMAADDKTQMKQPADTAEYSSGATQIEVTPEMIEAGLEAYNSRCPDTGGYFKYDADMVREIFEAMYSVRDYKKPPPTEEELREEEMAREYWQRKHWAFKDAEMPMTRGAA